MHNHGLAAHSIKKVMQHAQFHKVHVFFHFLQEILEMSKLRPEMTVPELNKRSGENLPGLMGVEALEVSENTLKSRMVLRKVHFAPNSYLHAASVIALADTTCGYATMAHLPKGALSFTTIELKSNHLGTVRGEGEVILCTATAQHLGGNTQVWDAVVSDQATGKKIALFRCTQMILWPKEAP
jgi:uncharacterized protein (TIGR00369 family)